MKKIIIAVIFCLTPAWVYAQQEEIPDIKSLEKEYSEAAVEKSAAAPVKAAQAAEIVPVIEPSIKKPALKDVDKPVVKSAAPVVKPAAPAAKPVAVRKRVPAPGPLAGPERRGLPSGFRPGSVTVLPKEERTAGGFKVLKIHTVVKGDTLWDLAMKYYKDPFMWGRIYNANFSSVANPDLIYPKDDIIIPDITELLIPYRKALPQTVQAAAEMNGDAYAGDDNGEDYVYTRSPAAKVTAASGEMPGLSARNVLSEEMPEDPKEWADGVRIVPDSWQGDGVVTAKLKNDDPFLEDGLSITGATLEVSMNVSGAFRPGDYLTIYIRGADAYDKAGNRLGREVQPAGLAEVLSVDNSMAKARVIDATTGISKGYIVKKK
jgi:hypothetical protein